MINLRDGEARDLDTTVGQTGDNLLRCLDVFGKGLLSVWYEWHTVDRSRAGGPLSQARSHGNMGQFITAAPGVVAANRAAVNAGGYPMAYILACAYDGGDPEDFPNAKRAIMRDLKGEFYGGPGTWCSMCLSAEWFQKRYAEKCRRAIEESGFRGVYWDTFGSPLPRCFADDHGHSHGGGTQGVQGARQFAARARAAMKTADPEAFTSAEASSEEFIDLVDTRLCAMILREHVAPIYSCVYHDYQLFFGRRIMPLDGEPIFSMIAGYTFNIGGQFGRYFIAGEGIQADDPQYAQAHVFLKRLIDAKRSAGEFLNVGRMVRPPRILSDLPTLTGRHWYKKRMLTLPAVLCSAWKSPSREVALVFVNCSPERVDFTYEIDAVGHGFPERTKIARRLRKPDGDVLLTPIISETYKERDRLEGHGVKIIVLSEG